MITPVILCGGSGARLWPVSKNSDPRQFVPLLGAQTLFQSSVAQMAGTFLWNLGIFLCRTKDSIAAFQTLAPDLIDSVAQSLTDSKIKLGFCRLDLMA